MRHERGTVDEETHALNMMLEVYVRNRPDPLMWPMRMEINRKVTKVEQIMCYWWMTCTTTT